MFLALADARRRWNVKMRAGSAADGAAIQDSYEWDESAADICWMQITRRRSTFVVSVKTDATEKWRELYVYEDADKVFDKELFIGPASCSGSCSGWSSYSSCGRTSFTELAGTGSVLRPAP